MKAFSWRLADTGPESNAPKGRYRVNFVNFGLLDRCSEADKAGKLPGAGAE